MFSNVTDGLAEIIKANPWVSEVASILPLSALIDFIDIPVKLHTLQLTGGCPLWSWAITPLGSRLLLSDESKSKACFLDQYGNSIAFTGLDGRYGDQYLLPSPETVRICISSQAPNLIDNPHSNMHRDNLRLQNLELIHVTRLSPERAIPPLVGRFGLPRVEAVYAWLRMYSLRYIATSLFGWVAFACLIVLGAISHSYLAVASLGVVAASGLVVSLMHGNGPRRLLVNDKSNFNRLIIVAENMNTSNWTVFYGESTVLNSLLNRPLEPRQHQAPAHWVMRMMLRILILAQWALAIGTAASKDWNAYYFSFWIIFGIVAHAYFIPLHSEIRHWMWYSAGIRIERYQTQLSSRRALLNTFLALNPDSFPARKDLTDDSSELSPGARKAIDPILEPGEARTRWEAATREAMVQCAPKLAGPQLKHPSYWNDEGTFLSSEWRAKYRLPGDYWKPYICEGISMAAKIKAEAELPGRWVHHEVA